MKKLLLLTTTLVLASATAAQAGVSIGLQFDNPRPVYVEPRPVYVAPQPVYYVPPHEAYYHYTGRDRHRYGYDWAYWHNKNRHEEPRHDDHHR